MPYNRRARPPRTGLRRGAIDALKFIDRKAFLGVTMFERDGEPKLVRALAPITKQFGNCRRI